MGSVGCRRPDSYADNVGWAIINKSANPVCDNPSRSLADRNNDPATCSSRVLMVIAYRLLIGKTRDTFQSQRSCAHRIRTVHEPAVSIIRDDTESVADPTAHRRFRTVIAAVVVAGVIVSIVALAITRPSTASTASLVVVDIGLDRDISQYEIDEMLQWFEAEPAVIDKRIMVAVPFDRLRITTCIGNVTIRLLAADETAAAAVRRLVGDRYQGPGSKINGIGGTKGDMTNPLYCPFVPNRNERGA